MKIIRIAIFLYISIPLISCKPEKYNELFVVVRPEKNELAIITYGNEIKLLNQDSCSYNQASNEYIYHKQLKIKKNEPIYKFSIILLEDCKKVIDTTITSKDELRLIGIMPGSYQREKRVYYYTDKTMITY